MTSIIKVQTLTGADGETPHCHLLQVDECRFLLDAGWDENFNLAYLKDVRKHINQIDAVLLTFPDQAHLGALPYLFGKCGLSCAVYATVPVYKMGQMFLYDQYQSRHNTEDFDVFTLDDVDSAFDKIVQLKYNQSVALKGRGQGLTITPLAAGHMIGGTMWKIVKDGEEDILYAVDFNHKKERHLNGCDLEHVSRPSLMITDAYNATYQPARRRQRDEQLMTIILQTLRGGGNVLVAIDTAGRMLELAHMLDQLWRNKDSGLMTYSLALLNNVSYNVVEFAKSQIEWMSDKLMRSFEGARNNPFQFKHMQLCHSLAEVNRIRGPKVVLASSPDLECGFSRELFVQWCTSAKNHVILTSRTSSGTLARELVANKRRALSLQVKQRVRLEGAELEEYRRRQLEAKRARALELAGDVDSSDESDAGEAPLTADGHAEHDLVLTNGKPNPLFYKSSKRQHPVFPHVEERIKYDDYGELIRANEFAVAEEEAKPEPVPEEVEPADREMQDVSTVPSKCLAYYRTFNVAAGVTYIDFEGRTDGESLYRILEQLRPRRLVLLRGTDDVVQPLIPRFSQVAEKVLVPRAGHPVDATTESHIYQVRLRDSLVSSLTFSKGRDAEVAWLDGVVTMATDQRRSDVTAPAADVAMETEEDADEPIPTLELLPADQAPSHPTVFINELRLSDFKQALVRLGIASEFSGGVLWCCNGTVALRRQEQGHITIEGCLSDDFFQIRELLYGQYAIV
ncbi:cleavage and polyadenylation specificity factor subunit 2-like [Pollicipes pollicipes]|uniref:cleavage and polyadenylation specificity factor subunit 2-like n=1 Tax=Pollicipes pollicipes TaxID=41117 RepID=UPI0018853307|nr:cleavage and polyadenylation specificity factor subunit 2-like [Pollicipes pollicipes]